MLVGPRRRHGLALALRGSPRRHVLLRGAFFFDRMVGDPNHWLVATVAVLVTAIAAAMLTAAWRRHASLEVAVLALASAQALALIDVTYVVRERSRRSISAMQESK